MRKFSYLFLLTVVAFAACTQPFKKAKDGTEYKIVSKKSGKLITAGNIMQMNAYVNYGDSVLMNSVETGMPQFQPYDTANYPPLYKEIFRSVHVGDSIIIRISTDSIIAKGQGQTAPFIKKGKYITQSYMITNAYATEAEADAARKAAIPVAEAIQKKKSEEILKKDDKTLTDYFAKNNIKAIKAPLGTYVEIIQPGTGPKIDTSMVVSTNYTGRTLKGVMFDSNTDPAKNHVEPFNVNLTNDPSLGAGVIPGWKDGFTLLSKGAKAKFYIPSSLAYGPQSPSQEIGPNEILVFDIEVADVFTKAQAMADLQSRQAKMQEMQKRYMDSMKKAMPDTSKRN